MSAAQAAVLGAAQVGALSASAPLLNGLVRKSKARLQSRHGPPLLQSYFDLAKWWARSEQVAETTWFVHRLAPLGIVAAGLVAVLFVPVFSGRAPLTTAGDLFVVVGLLALSRALLTLGGMDSGSTFGQMGSSREVAVGALVEPVLVLSLVTLAVAAGSTRLGDIVAYGDARGLSLLTLGWVLAGAGLMVTLIAETGRIPVDNPDTHLELTMIHEAMLIEYSGRSLGLLHFAAMLKQILLAVMLANLFLPFGLRGGDASGYALGAMLVVAKVGVIGLGLAVVESTFAKMRLFELPDLIGVATLTSLLGAALVVLS